MKIKESSRHHSFYEKLWKNQKNKDKATLRKLSQGLESITCGEGINIPQYSSYDSIIN